MLNLKYEGLSVVLYNVICSDMDCPPYLPKV